MVNQVFAGRCVRKDLVRAVKVGANVPVFVHEYLLGRDCASSDADAIELGLTEVRDTLANNHIRHAAIHDPAATIFVSAASGWELATRVRLGKPPGANQLLQELPSLLQQQGFQPLAVQLHHGVHAAGDPQAHRDPHRCAEDCLFARLLAAQADPEGLPLDEPRPCAGRLSLPPALVKHDHLCPITNQEVSR